MAGKGKPGPAPKGSHGKYDDKIIKHGVAASEAWQRGDKEAGDQQARITRHFHWKSGGTSDTEAEK